MGKIASKYCRKIFVTDDNPRNENAQKIRNAIIKGCKKFAVNIGSRKKAIRTAIQELGPERNTFSCRKRSRRNPRLW